MLQELLPQWLDLAIEEVVRLMQQAQSDVRHGCNRFALDQRALEFEGLWRGTPEMPDSPCFGRVLIPELQ